MADTADPSTNQTDMWLIYISDDGGTRHYQHWRDLPEVGTLIDPETGNDMDLLGWTTDRFQ